MSATLALGLFVHVLGYPIGIGTAPMPDWIPRELAATLVANLGIVLWTSVILVVFLDTLPARVRRTRRVDGPRGPEVRGARPARPRRAGRRRCSGDADEAVPTLEAVLERLTAIERRLAENESRQHGRAVDG